MDRVASRREQLPFAETRARRHLILVIAVLLVEIGVKATPVGMAQADEATYFASLAQH